MGNNLELWNKVKAVPDNAQKTITGGKLNGMTDVNPIWRIKTITEQFGVCGIGWYPEIVKIWVEDGAKGEKTANVHMRLYIYNDQTQKFSQAIDGIGGSKLIATEKGELVTNDECFKMAYTDAFSVCCKMLGVAADVYWQGDKTKYQSSGQSTGQTHTQQQDAPFPEAEKQPVESGNANSDITLSEALSFSLKSGKHANVAFKNVPEGYLRWIAENFKEERVKKAAQLVIDYLYDVKNSAKGAKSEQQSLLEELNSDDLGDIPF